MYVLTVIRHVSIRYGMESLVTRVFLCPLAISAWMGCVNGLSRITPLYTVCLPACPLALMRPSLMVV